MPSLQRLLALLKSLHEVKGIDNARVHSAFDELYLHRQSFGPTKV